MDFYLTRTCLASLCPSDTFCRRHLQVEEISQFGCYLLTQWPAGIKKISYPYNGRISILNLLYWLEPKS